MNITFLTLKLIIKGNRDKYNDNNGNKDNNKDDNNYENNGKE